MVQVLLDGCDGLARVSIAGLGNAAIPSLIVAVLAFAVMRLKAWNSASRYWAWCLLLGFVVLLPVAIILWHPPERRSSEPAPAARLLLASQDFGRSHQPAHQKFETVPQTTPEPVSSRTRTLPGLAVLFVLCCGASLVQLSRVALGLFTITRLKRRALVPPNSMLIALFEKAARALLLRRRVSLAISDEISAPVAIGYWKPCILLPASLVEGLEEGEIEQILSHELAHVSRYDDWMIGIQRLVEALFVFHPLVHFISRRIDLEREMACDDHVVSTSQTRTYAACLTKIAEMAELDPGMALSVPLFARKSHLAARVEMMLDRTRAHVPAVSVRHLLPFAFAGILAACVSLRTPAIIAFPAQQQMNLRFTPAETAIAAPSAVSTPVVAVVQPPEPPQASTPAKQAATGSSQDIDSVAITSSDGATTTFEPDGNEHRGHSPFPRDTIVFQRNGKSYIIRDRSTMDAAREILRPQEELSRQQEALGAQQAKLGEAQAKLGEQMAALANRQFDAATVKKIEKQLHDLEEKLRSIDVEKAMRTASEAQAHFGELQSLLGEMQAHIGDEQGKVGEAQGKLGEQQGLLGEQQGRLGEQQGKLGEQQARQAKQAEQKMKELIRRAEAQGLAQPLH
jgi:beta-lactamase regulating signal transducer with metallopeptidase domain